MGIEEHLGAARAARDAAHLGLTERDRWVVEESGPSTAAAQDRLAELCRDAAARFHTAGIAPSPRTLGAAGRSLFGRARRIATTTVGTYPLAGGLLVLLDGSGPFALESYLAPPMRGEVRGATARLHRLVPVTVRGVLRGDPLPASRGALVGTGLWFVESAAEFLHVSVEADSTASGLWLEREVARRLAEADAGQS